MPLSLQAGPAPGKALLFMLLLAAHSASAQSTSSSDSQPSGSPGFFSRLWLSGQVNLVAQGHGRFRSPYEGSNSFRSAASTKVSRVLTLYTGLRVSNNTDIIFNLEQTSGANLSGALGLAGFPNLDTVAVPSTKPYVARALLHHSFSLGGKSVDVNRGPLQLAPRLPEKRLEVYAGKFSMPDFFDVNAVGGDSHFQFLNWSMNNNAAYGYPAETRGYTYGLVLEFHQPRWTARFAEALQAKADGPDEIDTRIARSHSEHFELELRASLLSKRVGVVRLLSFRNHGPLALYRDAIGEFQSNSVLVPDTTRQRRPNRKYGFGLNLEQELTPDLRAYVRFGWAEGRAESLANTDANQALSGGFDHSGMRWRRPDDRFGCAGALTGISRDHRNYLALGGKGAVLGDGRLNYGWEKTMELYYTTKLRPGIYFSVDLQRISNPGYNRDRGPLFVTSLRLHLEASLFSAPR